MKTTHTPGPWRHNATQEIEGYTNGLATAVWTEGKKPLPIATTDFSVGKYKALSPAEQDANARLIAAAPDLLAALQSIVNNPDMADGQEPWRLIVAARAAIAQAKGEA